MNLSQVLFPAVSVSYRNLLRCTRTSSGMRTLFLYTNWHSSTCTSNADADVQPLCSGSVQLGNCCRENYLYRCQPPALQGLRWQLFLSSLSPPWLQCSIMLCIIFHFHPMSLNSITCVIIFELIWCVWLDHSHAFDNWQRGHSVSQTTKPVHNMEGSNIYIYIQYRLLYFLICRIFIYATHCCFSYIILPWIPMYLPYMPS